MNTRYPAKHSGAATSKVPLDKFLPNGTGAFWLSYLMLISTLLAWLIT